MKQADVNLAMSMLDAFNHPTRQKILTLLKQKPMRPSELQKYVKCGQELMRYHIRKMVKGKLVTRDQRMSKVVFLSIRPKSIELIEEVIGILSRA